MVAAGTGIVDSPRQSRSPIGWLLHALSKHLTASIMVGLVLGVLAGWMVNQGLLAGVASAESWARGFQVLSTIFLNLIKMVVAPLVVGTIITGLAHMGDSTAVGRIGFRAIAWFIVASLISISLGLLMVNLFQPGVGVDVAAPAQAIGEVKKLDFFEFVEHVFPKNIIGAMADNNVLQILVFALFAGIGLTAIGEKGRPLIRAAESLADLMLEITGYVMRFAPFAVFGALAAVVAKSGLGILVVYAKLLGEFYFTLLILWAILIGAGFVFLGAPRAPPHPLCPPAGADRVFDSVERGGDAKAVRAARPLRHPAPHFGADGAAGLQLQS